MANVLEIVFGVKNAALKSGVAEAKGILNKFRGDAMGALAGAVTVGAITSYIGQVVAFAGEIQDLSEVYGVSTTALQQWGHAAEQNASSAEAVAKALQKLTVNQSEALAGNQTMIGHFATLGVTLGDLQALGPDQLLRKIGTSSMNAAALVKVLGKSAIELRPALRGVASGSTELGAAMSESAVAGLAAFDDAMLSISRTLKVYTGQEIQKFREEMRAFTIDAGNFWDALKGGDVGGAFRGLFAKETEGMKRVREEAAELAEEQKIAREEQRKAAAQQDDEKATERAEKRQDAEEDRLRVMQEEERVGERAAQRMETMLEYDRKLRDLEKEIAEARGASNTELVDSLEHLKKITQQQKEIATDAAKAAFSANGGQAPSVTDLRRKDRAQRAQNRKQQNFRDRLVDGVIPTEFGIGGEPIAGVDPVTGEKVKIDKGGQRGVDRRQKPPGEDVKKGGAGAKDPVVTKLGEMKSVLDNIEKKVTPPIG